MNIARLMRKRSAAVFALIAATGVAIADSHGKSVDEGLPLARDAIGVDRVFGLTLADSYLWMERKENAESQAWFKVQGDFTRQQLDKMPTLDARQARWIAASTSSAPINGDQQS